MFEFASVTQCVADTEKGLSKLRVDFRSWGLFLSVTLVKPKVEDHLKTLLWHNNSTKIFALNWNVGLVDLLPLYVAVCPLVFFLSMTCKFKWSNIFI